MVDEGSQDPVRRRIVADASRIEEDATYSSKGHYNSAAIWESRHMILGIGLAVMSAVGAVVLISPIPNNEAIAAVIATAVAGFSAVTTFLNPSAKAAQHHQYGSELNSIKDSARRLRTIVIHTDSPGQLNRKLDQLAEEKARINLSAPPILDRAFQQARRGIEAGEATYAVDRQGE